MFLKAQRQKSTSGYLAFYEQFNGDLLTPIAAAMILGAKEKAAILLESAEQVGEKSRFSCLGMDPYAEYAWSGEETNPWEDMRDLFAKHRARNKEELPGFIGGGAGYIGYDAIRSIEKIPDRHRHQKTAPDIRLQFFGTVLCFDHRQQIVTIALIRSASSDYDTVMEEVTQLRQRLMQERPKDGVKKYAVTEFESDLSDAVYCQKVGQAKEQIRLGEAFQIVLSRTFRKKSAISGLDLYRALTVVSPSPFMFYLSDGKTSYAGASPELLVSLNKKEVKTMPIAGTRPRAKEDAEDKKREHELLCDEKEVAEHMMLVDLGRNDIGKVCTPLSVKVEKLKVIERFSHVMHIISIVGGTLKKGYDGFDLLAATFPAGTLSGAPKVRAMQIIDQLEESRRGIYGGAIFSMAADGDTVACIAIRMGCVDRGLVEVRAGAGIVYDSNAQKEADETRAKAMSVMEAVKLAESGHI